MTSTACRPCWCNCAQQTDAEILEIDALEDRIAPLDPGAVKIRELISRFELCHHKAERWIHNVIEAIGTGETNKGLGSRAKGQLHPAEKTWQDACAALSAWCAGCPGSSIDMTIGSVPASRVLSGLGQRSPLKEWQVQRVIERIRSLIHWPEAENDPALQYQWLLFDAESFYRTACPDRFQEHEDFWQTTVRTIMHDTEGGRDAELSLGFAIDMLWPCHWRFVENLQMVLDAIGGNLTPEKPFTACARNIGLLPDRERMLTISRTLQAFCGGIQTEQGVEPEILALLGDPTDIKQWLTASLDKTIRLQLDPPDDMRALTAFEGPDWIKE